MGEATLGVGVDEDALSVCWKVRMMWVLERGVLCVGIV